MKIIGLLLSISILIGCATTTKLTKDSRQVASDNNIPECTSTTSFIDKYNKLFSQSDHVESEDIVFSEAKVNPCSAYVVKTVPDGFLKYDLTHYNNKANQCIYRKHASISVLPETNKASVGQESIFCNIK